MYAKQSALKYFGRRASAGGVTILELVVVSSIIGIIASVTLANFAQIRRSQALGRAAQKLAFDIRRTQTLALGGVDLGPSGGPPPRNICAYGISVQNSATYLIFGNRYLGGNTCGGQYNANGANADVIIDGTAITLENGITITSGPIDIAFRPPQPMILVNGGTLPATIRLYNGSSARCVTIAPTSQVNITTCP